MIWLNGALVDDDAAWIDPSDRGFTLGDGVFETLAVIAGAPRHLARHLARLRDGAAVLGFAASYDDGVIAGAIAALCDGAGLRDAAIRITLTRGPAPRGLLPPDHPIPTLMITAVPLPPPPQPARAVIARVTRRDEASPLCRIKSLNYLDNILARQEAAARGGDEAILLNTQGRIADATIANVFAVIDGAVVTPTVAEGALPGIRRALLLEVGKAAEGAISAMDLQRASEIFLTSSLSIRPVIALDGRPVGAGVPGPVYRALAL
jgi:branched-chain amino acid aminotransferase